MSKTEKIIRLAPKAITPFLLGFLLTACAGAKTDSSSNVCKLGTNIIDNTNLSVRLMDTKNYSIPPIDCKVPITMMFRQFSFAVPNYLEDTLNYYDKYGASLFIRITETKNSGNQWPAPKPEEAFAIGEKIAHVAKGKPYPINIIPWNEPNLHTEWSEQASPEAFADVLVASVNGLNRSDDQNDNVRLYLSPISFCNSKCNELGIDPKIFYTRFYHHLEEKLTGDMTDPDYKRLLVQQWIKRNFYGFAINIYPHGEKDAIRQMHEFINLWHSSGLVREGEIPRVFVSEIGVPGGKADRNAGRRSCESLGAISTQFPNLTIVGATVYARDDGYEEASPYLPKQIGFTSQNCISLSIAE